MPNLRTVFNPTTNWPRPPRGWRMQVLDRTDSTNRYIIDQLAYGPRDHLAVVALEQTAGRGRRDRRWISRPGASLTLSIYLSSRLPHDRLHVLPKIAALALVAAVTEVTGARPVLKWPNDLLIDGEKVAGILTETKVMGAMTHLVIGAGLNVNWDREELGMLKRPATSLLVSTGRPSSLQTITHAYLAGVDRYLDPDGEATDERALLEYSDLCATLGALVSVELEDGVIVGTATSIRSDGALVIEGPSGPVGVVVGEVVHLRDATPGDLHAEDDGVR